MMNYRIKQIIPNADGWRDVFFANKEDGPGTHKPDFLALVEVGGAEQGYDIICGLSVDPFGWQYLPVDLIEDSENSPYCGLCPPGGDPRDVSIGLTGKYREEYGQWESEYRKAGKYRIFWKDKSLLGVMPENEMSCGPTGWLCNSSGMHNHKWRITALLCRFLQLLRNPTLMWTNW